MDLKFKILSLSVDLKRIARAINDGSLSSAERFTKEARNWLSQIKIKNKNKDLLQVDKVLNLKNDLEKAEHCLMYAVLLQNRVNLF